MTQPVFDLRPARAWCCRRSRQFGIPIIAGIWPLVSLRNAEFLANEVPGITIPDRGARADAPASALGKDAALAEGVAIAREMLRRDARARVAGVQVAAPTGAGGGGAGGAASG